MRRHPGGIASTITGKHHAGRKRLTPHSFDGIKKNCKYAKENYNQNDGQFFGGGHLVLLWKECTHERGIQALVYRGVVGGAVYNDAGLFG